MRRWTDPGTCDELTVLVVPSDQRFRLFSMAHDQHGHQGVERTYHILRQRCYWPGLLEDVTAWVQQCARCQPAKKSAVAIRQRSGHLIASQPLEVLALDFLTVDQASDGTEHVLTMTHVLTMIHAWTMIDPNVKITWKSRVQQMYLQGKYYATI